jgi:hypothetical protein
MGQRTKAASSSEIVAISMSRLCVAPLYRLRKANKQARFRLCHRIALRIISVQAYILRVPAKEPKREFHVGDHVTVSLSGGRIVDATVTAVVKRTKGTRLQVSYGKDETALVYLWQVHAADRRG